MEMPPETPSGLPIPQPEKERNFRIDGGKMEKIPLVSKVLDVIAEVRSGLSYALCETFLEENNAFMLEFFEGRQLYFRERDGQREILHLDRGKEPLFVTGVWHGEQPHNNRLMLARLLDTKKDTENYVVFSNNGYMLSQLTGDIIQLAHFKHFFDERRIKQVFSPIHLSFAATYDSGFAEKKLSTDYFDIYSKCPIRLGWLPEEDVDWIDTGRVSRPERPFDSLKRSVNESLHQDGVEFSDRLG